MLIDIKKYSNSLKNLWSAVFGDSREYISLIFDNGYSPAEVFGEIVDGEVVSALYLLKCNIELKDNTYSGRYLYAAATLREYRKKGIMSRLIYEAEEYISKENIDFIALVPASESLYSYYSRYGFETLMYKFVSFKDNVYREIVDDEEICIEDFLELRNSFSSAKFTFESAEMKYALSCLDFAGYRIYRNSDDSYYISDKNKTEIIEYISSYKNFDNNTKLLLSKINDGAEISSPYDLSKFCKSEKQPFGMIYTENKCFLSSAINGIYMNIALD